MDDRQVRELSEQYQYKMDGFCMQTLFVCCLALKQLHENEIELHGKGKKLMNTEKSACIFHYTNIDKKRQFRYSMNSKTYFVMNNMFPNFRLCQLKKCCISRLTRSSRNTDKLPLYTKNA